PLRRTKQHSSVLDDEVDWKDIGLAIDIRHEASQRPARHQIPAFGLGEDRDRLRLVGNARDVTDHVWRLEWPKVPQRRNQRPRIGTYGINSWDRIFLQGRGNRRTIISMTSAVIGAAGLAPLVSVLIDRGYRVIGPTVSDNAIILAELTTADDLPCGWGVDVGPGHYRLRRRDDDALFGHSAGPQSWKQFLHPPRQQLWSSDGIENHEPPRYAFIGVRACDLSAIAILNGVLGEGTHTDQGFV